jgi:hypothetical protein
MASALQTTETNQALPQNKLSNANVLFAVCPLAGLHRVIRLNSVDRAFAGDKCVSNQTFHAPFVCLSTH